MFRPQGCVYPLCRSAWHGCVRETCRSELAVMKASRFVDVGVDANDYWCEYPDCDLLAEYTGIVREDLAEGVGINRRIQYLILIKKTVRMYVCVRHRHIFRTGGELIDSYIADKS